MTGKDAADSERLADAIKGITPALEHFYRFEGPDLAARQRDAWLAELGVPLPEQGRGLDDVDGLVEAVVWIGDAEVAA